MITPTILIVEDGDEYLEALTALGAACNWVQARSAADAGARVAREPVACVVLDMRFDRIPREHLAGDLTATVRQVGGDVERAWRYLAQHQGLFVLAELRSAGWQGPALLAYDFTREARRFDALRSLYAPIDWIGDDASANTWRTKLSAACASACEAR